MFENVDKKVIKTPNQVQSGDKVIKGKVGRKPQPNMKKYLFSMDKVLNSKLTSHAKRVGTNKSSIVNRLVADYLKEIESTDFRRSVAKNLINEGIDLALIVKATGLTLEDLKSI